jgi:hypothetical protein
MAQTTPVCLKTPHPTVTYTFPAEDPQNGCIPNRRKELVMEERLGDALCGN